MSCRRCCVPGCFESDDTPRPLHLFPNPKNDIERFRSWVHVIGGEILSLSNEMIYKLRKVCRLHFEERYLCRFNRISNIAMPTLLMPGLPISKLHKERSAKEDENLLATPIAESVNNNHDNVEEIQHADHTYCLSEVEEDPFRANNNEMDNDGCDAFISDVLKKHSQTENTELGVPEDLEKCPQNVNIEMYTDVNSPLSTKHLDLPSTSLDEFMDSPAAEMGTDVTSPLRTESLDMPSKSVGELMESPTSDQSVDCTASNKNEPSKYEILQRKYKNLRRRLNTQLRAKKALKYSKENFFFKLTKNMNPLAKQFFWMQVQQSSKKAKGRRFSEEDKLLAMAILQQSSKCYRFLQNIFILPSDYTLSKSVKSKNTGETNGEVLETVEEEI